MRPAPNEHAQTIEAKASEFTSEAFFYPGAVPRDIKASDRGTV